MPKKKPATRTNEILIRSIEITSIEASVSISAPTRRGYQPRIEARSWLTLSGLMSEPVRGVSAVEVNLQVDDSAEQGSARPASVGAIIQMRPCVCAVVGFPQFDFDRVWSLALLGHLEFGHFAFTKPYRNSALVVGMSFSTRKEE